jgi:glycosyltransferase involved in cell wall biosynthesis
MEAAPPTRPLRVAWVGPFDIEAIAHRVPQSFTSRFHPATWIRNAALALAGHPDVELHVLSHDKRFERDYTFEERGIRFHLLHAPIPAVPRPLALYQLDRWRYYRALREIAPDIVHGHGTENAYSYVTVTSGFPHVISIQAIIRDLVRQYRRVSRRMLEHLIVRGVERYTVRRAANVIIKAPFAEAFVRSLNPRASLFLLENIVHEAYFAVERDQAAIGPRVLFVGTIIQTKGVEELIRAFHHIAGRVPGASLELIGTGDEAYVRNVVRPLADSGPGAARIRFLGQRSSAEIAREFQTAAMLVLPSCFDTSPNVVAEAMVAGLPVIGTDVGGIPFMIRDGETGRVVPLRDERALVDAIAGYLDDRPLACRHGELARAEGRARWTRERFVDRLLAIYQEIVTRTPSSTTCSGRSAPPSR